MNEREVLLNFLKTQRIMTLATVGSNGPWIANVYYAVDDDLCIYFLSHPQARHSMEIASNGLVAIAIASTEQKLAEKKIGVQMQGMAQVVQQGDDHSKAIELWLDAQSGFEDGKIFESVKAKFAMGTIYRVCPQLVHFLNEELYGENGIKEIKV